MKNNQKGITLIALIITIIVMLILVAVTINVALNGGLFKRAKEATIKTEIQQIKEQLLVEKAKQIADNEINGTTGYSISIDDLNISAELKNKYRNKLIISSDGDLKYNEENCTEEEKAFIESLDIESVSDDEKETYAFYMEKDGETMFLRFSIKKYYGFTFICGEVTGLELGISTCIDNGDNTYTDSMFGTVNVGTKPPTLTLRNDDEAVQLTKETGNLFDSYTIKYHEYLRDGVICKIPDSGCYINDDKDVILRVSTTINEDGHFFQCYQQTPNDTEEKNYTGYFNTEGDGKIYFYSRLRQQTLPDGSTIDILDKDGKVITITDTNNNVERFTLIERFQ